MKKAVVSLAAVVMVLASLAVPSFAGQSQTHVFELNGARISVTVPTTGEIGGAINVRVSITALDNGTSARTQNIGWRVSAPGVSRSPSGFHEFPVGKTKTLNKSFAISSRIPAGDYQISVLFTANGDTKGAQLPITLTSK